MCCVCVLQLCVCVGCGCLGCVNACADVVCVWRRVLSILCVDYVWRVCLFNYVYMLF